MPVVPNFQHVTGRHCGSTALSDMVRHAGWPLSEAACFGLGAGMESIFLEGNSEYPTGWFLGRGTGLEDTFFETTGIPYPRRQARDFSEVVAFMNSRLPRMPVMVQGDVAGLPYYNSPEHFSGHKFVVAGTDTDGAFLTADTAFPGFQRVERESLEKAMVYQTDLFPGRYTYFDIPFPLPALQNEQVVAAVRKSLMRQSENLAGKAGRQTGPFHHGPQGFIIWKNHVNMLAEQKDPQRAASARFMYQVIEKRGTGRGAFRFIYADFLEELAAGTLASNVAVTNRSDVSTQLRLLSQSAQRAGDFYRKIASGYRVISLGKSDITQSIPTLHTLIDAVASEEQNLAFGLMKVAATV